jgi:hypothetical protein
VKNLTIAYLFTDEELDDIASAALEHHVKAEELIREAVLDKLAA